MSTIFYSQVNPALQRELIARGSAGVTDRSTSGIAYMVEKIANVEIRAYESAPKKGSNPLPGYGVLGGLTTLQGAYMPNGPEGYLNDQLRPAHRIPPVITELNISINDQSKSYINKAIINILVTDATTDMENIEDIWCKPGRHVLFKIVHPESAILSEGDGILSSDGLPSTAVLQTIFPDSDANNLRKMNEFQFVGRISTFSYSYNVDGSVSVTIEAIGTSNTYVTASAYITGTPSNTATKTKIVNQVNSIYTSLSDAVDAVIQSYNKDKITEFEHVVANTSDQSILVGVPYIVGTTNSPETNRMISLGYLIEHINTKIYKQISNDIKIICNDRVCFSNYYEKLVSADPCNILLFQGNSSIKSSTYNKQPGQEFKMFPNIVAKSDGFSINSESIRRSYPSRIYINLQLIKTIIDKITNKQDPSIKQFLNELSAEIKQCTGDAINLALVQEPVISEALLFYDTNYVTTNALVSEFLLPVFATSTGASVVRSFTLTSKVPNSVKAMIFGLNSADISTLKQTAYNPYIYANDEEKQQLVSKWKEEYEVAIADLQLKTETYAKRPIDIPNIMNLKKTLEKYVTYFTPDIKESIGTNKSVFPMELEFTIDGINGLKYGDVFSFPGLPKRYIDSFIFTILGITHNVSETGEWTTIVKCNPRVRINE